MKYIVRVINVVWDSVQIKYRNCEYFHLPSNLNTHAFYDYIRRHCQSNFNVAMDVLLILKLNEYFDIQLWDIFNIRLFTFLQK
jgi:hypothetical protein